VRPGLCGSSSETVRDMDRQIIIPGFGSKVSCAHTHPFINRSTVVTNEVIIYAGIPSQSSIRGSTAETLSSPYHHTPKLRLGMTTTAAPTTGVRSTDALRPKPADATQGG
jgi:hypothetical protein